MLVDHLFQYRISTWPIIAEKRGFCTGVTDRRTDGRTDGRTDRPFYRDAMTHLKKKENKKRTTSDHIFCCRVRFIKHGSR